ncbi:hypothetical protein [Marinoscillum sp. MHG1-6]|uniref:hypothetical protein n=1 Tax=Marinoscillum sp. MHG1-6 TaxID=2959627 RepID=UPI0021572CA9|nr:hypothetical protein [Marinoscillum sp. MHG1-6]
MKFRITTSIFLLIFCLDAFCQDIELEQEILGYQDTTLLLIQNSRKLILENVKKWDIKRANQVHAYVSENVDHEFYTAFNVGEELLLDLILRKYSQVLLICQYWDSLESHYYGYPQVEDNFFGNLTKLTVDNQAKIEGDIDGMVYSVEQKEFLKLLLQLLLSTDPSLKITQEDLNVLGREYLKDYPGSQWEKFIKKNIIYELAPVDKGYGMFMGSGYCEIGGSTSDFIQPKVPFYFGFDFLLNHWVAGFKIIGGKGDLVSDLNVKGQDFQSKGVDLNPLLVSFYGAYSLVSNKLIRFYPFVSIGGFSVTPVENDRSGNKKFNLSSFAYGGGAAIDFRLFKIESPSYTYYYSSPAMIEFGLKATYDIMMFDFDQSTPAIGGYYQSFGLTLYMDFLMIERL